MVDEILEQRCVENRLGRERLSGDGRTDHGKNARTDHSADPQRRERPGPQRLLKLLLRPLRIRNQLVDRLLGEKLAGQKASSNYRHWTTGVTGQAWKKGPDDAGMHSNAPLRHYLCFNAWPYRAPSSSSCAWRSHVRVYAAFWAPASC